MDVRVRVRMELGVRWGEETSGGKVKACVETSLVGRGNEGENLGRPYGWGIGDRLGKGNDGEGEQGETGDRERAAGGRACVGRGDS